MSKFVHNAYVLEEEVLSKVGPFELKQLTVARQTFSGKLGMLPFNPVVFERGDSAAALLYDLERQVVILTYQFRTPAFLRPAISDGWIYEIMAGTMEIGEDGQATIKREAIEEIGYRVIKTEHIHNFFVSPGGTSEVIYLYAARVSTIDQIAPGGGLASEGEDIRRIEMNIWDAFKMLDDGLINDAKTIIALMWLRRNI